MPVDFSTIQAAVDSAQPGDRILVASGDYAGAQVTRAVEIRGTGNTRIVSGPLHPAGLKFGFLIGAFADGAGGNGVTITELTFADTVDIAVYSRGANNVTVSHNLFLNTYQGVTNRGGSGWDISHNTFRDLRSNNGGGIAIVLADQSARHVQHNLVAHNKISGTLHVDPADLGDYSGVGIALFADFRYGQDGALSLDHNRIVKNSVALVSDSPGVVDVEAFELTIGVAQGIDASALAGLIHDNEVVFNDFSGTENHVGFWPAAVEANNSLFLNLGENLSGRGDFDGDGRADVAAFSPSNGTWSVGNSSDVVYGAKGDLSVSGDYNGDGVADLGIFRPSDGKWYIKGIVNGFHFGAEGDVPVPADYDGDGKTDFAIFRPSNGMWFIANSSTKAASFSWGVEGDLPVAGDYDGDGKADLAIFRPSNHAWYIAYSSTGFKMVNGFLWGAAEDVLVQGDYDGDGKTDIATYRPSEGNWYIIYSTIGPRVVNWGAAGDVPVPGDYDGDGKTDFAIFRPMEGRGYVINGISFDIAKLIPKL